LRLDLCYNTAHELDARFDWELVRIHFCAEGRRHSHWRCCESEQGSILDLPQLLDRVARTSLRAGLPEMRLLFELL